MSDHAANNKFYTETPAMTGNHTFSKKERTMPTANTMNNGQNMNQHKQTQSNLGASAMKHLSLFLVVFAIGLNAHADVSENADHATSAQAQIVSPISPILVEKIEKSMKERKIAPITHPAIKVVPVVSGLAGMEIGESVGAAIGSIICPGLGTAVGGVIGGITGGTLGYMAGNKLEEQRGK